MDVLTIVFQCPNTGKATRTGHEVADVSQFKFIGLLPETVQCEHCPETQTWSQEDAWAVTKGE